MWTLFYFFENNVIHYVMFLSVPHTPEYHVYSLFNGYSSLHKFKSVDFLN